MVKDRPIDIMRVAGAARPDDPVLCISDLVFAYADAPLPPGVPTWPQPGEACVSPQLEQELTGPRATMFGHVSGVIDRSALATPTERHVYVRPHADVSRTRSAQGVSSFGVFNDSAAVSSGQLYRAPLSMSASLIMLAVIIPGCITVGAVGLLIALVVTITRSVRHQVEVVAPLTAICGTHAFVVRAATIIVVTPVLLSGGLALICDHVLPIGMQHIINDPTVLAWQTQPQMTRGIVVATCVSAAGASLAAHLGGARRCRSWRPGMVR